MVKKAQKASRENFSLDEQSALQALKLDIPLQRLDKGNSIVLNNIFFDTEIYSYMSNIYLDEGNNEKSLEVIKYGREFFEMDVNLIIAWTITNDAT